MRHVQAALSLVALVAVLVVGCSANDSTDSTTTAVPTTALATTTLGSAATSMSGGLPGATRALLDTNDLPPGYGWDPVPIEEDFWDLNGGRIVVPFCEDRRNVVSEPTLRELTNGMPLAVSYEGSGAHIDQVVYPDTSRTTDVETAYDDVAHELDECIVWWEQNPASWILDEYVEEGWHWEVERIELPTSGVESYGITYHLVDGNETYAGYGYFRLAMVRNETHLMVVHLVENGNEDGLPETGFASIVDSALEQLSDA